MFGKKKDYKPIEALNNTTHGYIPGWTEKLGDHDDDAGEPMPMVVQPTTKGDMETMRQVARTLCRIEHTDKKGCYCGGNASTCIAVTRYTTQAVGIVRMLRQEDKLR